MKKIFILVLLLSFSAMIGFSDDISTNTSTSSMTTSEEGFELVLSKEIGKQITVYLLNGDTSFYGKLIKVYKDGIVIENFLKKELFFVKTSIAFVELRK